MQEFTAQGQLFLGDNLPFLAALNKNGLKVKCAYFDPPYNNRDRFKHYIDAFDEEIWCELLRERARITYELLSEDGSLWVSIDDSMLHFVRFELDKIFGRKCYVATIIWNHRNTRENRSAFSKNHEYILVYAKNSSKFTLSRSHVPYGSDWENRFSNPDNDPRGPWQSVSASVQAGHGTPSQFYTLTFPDGRVFEPPAGRCWSFSRERMLDLYNSNSIWFGKKGTGSPRIKRFKSEFKKGLTPETLWLSDAVGTTSDAKKHIISLIPEGNIFETPKPESLLKKIIHIATKPGDMVLDPYLGSGTTAAVAHKMGRRYIGIEQSPDCMSIVQRRLKAVCAGEQGGISRELRWTGGGDYFVAT